MYHIICNIYVIVKFETNVKIQFISVNLENVLVCPNIKMYCTAEVIKIKKSTFLTKLNNNYYNNTI